MEIWPSANPAKPAVLKLGMPIPASRAKDLFECVLETLDPDTSKVLASMEFSGDYAGLIALAMLLRKSRTTAA